jgi:hypothetical protein
LNGAATSVASIGGTNVGIFLATVGRLYRPS